MAKSPDHASPCRRAFSSRCNTPYTANYAGPDVVANYSPTQDTVVDQDLLERVGQLYAGDGQLDDLWNAALETRALLGSSGVHFGIMAAELGRTAARLMLPANGARLVMLETGGWDTHSNQEYALRVRLANLDTLIGAIVDGLGVAWKDTLILVATEFGRTARVNGSGGTDHGTGAAAFIFGGGLDRGDVTAEWPGLAPGSLYQQRDLRPTRSLESVITVALADHFSLDEERVARQLYPAQAIRAFPL